MRLFKYSAVNKTPLGEEERKTGLLKAANTPNPLAKDAVPLPAMV